MTDERWTRVPESLRQDMGIDDDKDQQEAATEAADEATNAEDNDSDKDNDDHKQKLSEIPAHERRGVIARRSESLAERALRNLEKKEREEIERAKLRRKREIEKGRNIH